MELLFSIKRRSTASFWVIVLLGTLVYHTKQIQCYNSKKNYLRGKYHNPFRRLNQNNNNNNNNNTDGNNIINANNNNNVYVRSEKNEKNNLITATEIIESSLTPTSTNMYGSATIPSSDATMHPSDTTSSSSSTTTTSTTTSMSSSLMTIPPSDSTTTAATTTNTLLFDLLSFRLINTETNSLTSLMIIDGITIDLASTGYKITTRIEMQPSTITTTTTSNNNPNNLNNINNNIMMEFRWVTNNDENNNPINNMYIEEYHFETHAYQDEYGLLFWTMNGYGTTATNDNTNVPPADTHTNNKYFTCHYLTFPGTKTVSVTAYSNNDNEENTKIGEKKITFSIIDSSLKS